MKLSEVFRKAAEWASADRLGNTPPMHHDDWSWFWMIIGDDAGRYSVKWMEKEHWVLALCMAASIAESEGL